MFSSRACELKHHLSVSMGIFTNTVQPDLLTLLSSTSEPSISPLFETHVDVACTSSFIAIVDDKLCRQTALGSVYLTAQLIKPQDDSGRADVLRNKLVPIAASRGTIAGPTIHLQSPSWRSTFLQAGSRKGKEKEFLDIQLEWLGLHVRPLGKRSWGFEVGIIDARGVEGVVRVSSKQDLAELDLEHDPPMIHLPLALPDDNNALTPWLHINIHLPSLILHFSSLLSKHVSASPPRKKQKTSPRPVPTAAFRSITFVRLFANCRLRRVWCSRAGERTLRSLECLAAAEMGLYAARAINE